MFFHNLAKSTGVIIKEWNGMSLLIFLSALRSLKLSSMNRLEKLCRSLSLVIRIVRLYLLEAIK